MPISNLIQSDRNIHSFIYLSLFGNNDHFADGVHLDLCIVTS